MKEDLFPPRKIVYLPLVIAESICDTEYKAHKKMNEDIGFNRCVDLIWRSLNDNR